MERKKKKRKKKREKEEKRKLNPGGEFADRVRDERCVKNEPMKRLLYSISRERERERDGRSLGRRLLEPRNEINYQ